MPVDLTALQSELEAIERDLIAYRKDYTVGRPHSPYSRDAERLIALRHGPEGCSTREPGIILYGVDHFACSNHLKIEQPRRRAALFARGARVAELLKASLGFAQDDLRILITLHAGKTRPKVEMSIDELPAHASVVLVPTLVKSLGKKLDQLEKITPGPSATWLVREATIHAPDPGAALLKYALFCEPSLLTKQDNQWWPTVARVHDASSVVAAFKTLRAAE